MLTEDREFNEEEEADDEETAVNNAMRRAGGGGGGDEVLLSMLKGIRKDQARRFNLPAWVIFPDPSLEDMSIQYPVTLDELLRCQGVGDGKARKYGKDYVDVIARYVEENEIERPDDLLLRSVPNKSASRVMIIQSIDRKLPFEDIAEARGITIEELIAAVEAIVGNGTALNIDYYIHQEVDSDIVDEIYTYFKEEAETDSVTDAMKALGPDYREEEIRLVRIKFLSENGN